MTFLANEELTGLVDLCIRGDRKAQRKVYEHLYGRMLGVCLRYAKDIDEAKDMLQDGFVKVFLNINKYNGDGSFEGWVRRIIVNTSIDQLRKQKHIHISLDAQDYEWLEEAEDGEIEWNHVLMRERDRVIEAVNNLSPAYRAVFNLYVIEGYPHKEIAEILGVSIGTSKSNLAKAKMNLKKTLKELQY